MIYDYTNAGDLDVLLDVLTRPAVAGFAVYIHWDHHQDDEPGEEDGFDIYADDGRGNGDFIAHTGDRHTALHVARALDAYKE